MPKRLDLEQAKERFANLDRTLLATEYVDANTDMPYRCNKCGTEGMMSMLRIYALQRSKTHIGCHVCFKQHPPRRISQEEAEARFAEQGFELVDEYRSNTQHLSYICKCGATSTMRITELKKRAGCPACAAARTKTENIKKYGAPHHTQRTTGKAPAKHRDE